MIELSKQINYSSKNSQSVKILQDFFLFKINIL
nr:MAG TPA: hypothetical protein [Bacteriophage sp.]